MRKYWTKEEQDFIRHNLATMTVKELAEHFDIEYPKMVDKISKMGLNAKKARGELWSREEDEILIRHYEYAPKDYLLESLAGRTWTAIFQRGNKTFNLSRKTQDHRYVNYMAFSEWNREVAYIAGFILADGHLHLGEKNYLQIEVARYDCDILEKIARFLEYRGNLYENKGSKKLQIKNVKVITDLRDKGIPITNKSQTARFPGNIPHYLEKDFIRGLIDGDGWSRFSKCDCTYNLGLCGTKELVTEVKDRLCVDCSTNKVRQQGPNCWRFNIKGKKAVEIAHWLYDDAPIYLDRKFNAFKEYLIFKNSPLSEKFGKDTD